MARRSQSSAQPPAAPSPATTRRLLKEHASIQQELGDPSFSPSGEPSVLPGGEEKVGLSGGEGTQMQNQRRKRSKVANPDLIELRPWDADGEDLFEWFAVIRGPKGGAYEGGIFELTIQIPPNYPTRPPSMHFRTKIFHPNVHWKTGEICLDVLQAQWSPAWTLSSACTAVLALLDAPEPDSPLNVDAGECCGMREEGRTRTARFYG